MICRYRSQRVTRSKSLKWGDRESELDLVEG